MPLDLEHFKTLVPLLDERQKRIFFTTLAGALGKSGVKQVHDFFGVNIKTIYAGRKEIKNGYKPNEGKIRRSGGGRKKGIDKQPERLEVFERVTEPYKAGLPQDDKVYWLRIQAPRIAQFMNAEGCKVSTHDVKEILKSLGYRKRSFIKSLPLNQVEHRDEQFRLIQDVVANCKRNGIPVISIDTKKKEMIGNFKRNGKVECQAAPLALDHDFTTLKDLMIVPHGIYDITHKVGYMTIGISHDTSAFVCENIERAWNNDLYKRYPGADTIVVLCAGGGSNSSSHRIFKQDLTMLAKRLKMNIFVMHYPPYCSKYNPIEHRLFSQITLSWKGAPLLSVQDAVERASWTTTKTGLKVNIDVTLKNYEIQRPIRRDYEYLLRTHVVFHKDLPKWNYLIKP